MATTTRLGAPPVAAVLDRFTGLRYEWGRRDCLAVAEACAVELHGHMRWLDDEPVAEWRKRPGSRALAAAIRRYGSMAQAYEVALVELGPYRRLEAGEAAEPGDQAVFGGGQMLSVAAHPWDTSKGRELLAALDGGHDWLAWLERGLAPVTGTPTTVYTCRPL